MEQDNRLSVCVCREEKLVLGLSRRSSCADVIRVLLEDQNRDSGLSHAPQSFCIVEKWRGLERVLPNNTKIWRLWLAWGPGQKDVKFVLVKCDATRSSPAARSAEARVVRSEPSPGAGAGSRLGPQGVCPEKQRRTVRKAFRKLRKINKRRARRDASCAERMETLVHVVLSQDHNIRQQLQRLEELEAEIELREARVHLQRVQQHGANYVQDTYLVTADTHTLCSKKIQQFEDYVTVCEALMQLQEEIRKREAQIDGLTAQIQEQLRLRRTPADTHLMHDSQLHRTPADTHLVHDSQLHRTPADTHLMHDSQLHLRWTPADAHLMHDSQLHRTPADTHLMHDSQLHRTPADTHLMHDSQLHRTPADTHLMHDSQLHLRWTPADAHLMHDSQLHLCRTPADTHLVHDSQLHRTPADTHLVHDSQLHRTPADTHLVHDSQLHRTPADTHLVHHSQLHRTPADTHPVHDSQLHQLHRTPADAHLVHDSQLHQLHRTPADTHLVHDSQLLLEEERIQTQLGASWYVSLRLQTDLKAVECDVELSGDIYAAKMKELNFLLQKVDALDLADVRDVAGDGRARVDSLDSQAEWLEQAKVFSSKAHVEDEDSDTGLSSLHSQDSEPQWEAVGF